MLKKLLSELNIEECICFKEYQLENDRLLIKARANHSDAHKLRDYACLFERIDKNRFDVHFSGNEVVITLKADQSETLP